MIKDLKILELDYETSPQIGYFFGSIWETNIIKVIRHEQVLTASYKWYGEKTVHVVGQNDFKDYIPGVLNDKSLIEFLAPIIAEADFLVAHNGDNFDFKVFNTRLLAHRLPPMPDVKTFDTKKLARGKFHFPSNKLNDIADFLGVGQKLQHHGLDMWLGCENGNESDWKTMKKYDKQDTILMDKIFTIILPYVKLPAMFDKVNDELKRCPNPICGSDDVSLQGYRILASGKKKRRYQCNVCGKWGHGNKEV